MSDEQLKTDLTPFNERTPATDAAEIAWGVCCFVGEVMERAGDGLTTEAAYEEFFVSHLEEIEKSTADGDAAYQALFDHLEKDPQKTAEIALLLAADIALNYCLQAVKEVALFVHANPGNNKHPNNKHSPDAWKYAADARYWQGIVVGTWGMRKDQPLTVLQLARVAANARHAPNRARAEGVRAAYRAGNYPSKDRAAEVLAPQFGISFRTARDHLKGI